MKNLLFTTSDAKESSATTWGLLWLRVTVGALMLTHGWGKLSNYGSMLDQFGDPIGLGPGVSLTLAVFAEFFCALGVVFGLLTRAAVIPLIITMLVAALIVHADDPFRRQEFALLYLIPFVTLLITGPGKMSLDRMMGDKLKK